MTAALVAGDALGNFSLYLPLWIGAAVAVAAAGFFLARHPVRGYAIALLAIVAAATVPVHELLAPRATPASLARFKDDSLLTLEGTVWRAPEHLEGDRTYLYVRAQLAGPNAAALAPARGMVRVTVIHAPQFRIGDEIRVSARIRFPRNDGDPGEFDYRAWLMRQGIAATMFVREKSGQPPELTLVGHRRWFPREEIEALRQHIGEFIDANLPPLESAEMRALIIGDRGRIDQQTRDRFALTGMAHLLVISGLHLGFVAAAAFALMRLVMGFFPGLMARGWGNKAAAAAAALAVAAYASIAGHHVSTMRALVMVLTYATAIMLDRGRELLASLAIAALVICMTLPGSTADIGFQLSFASVLAILLGMRRFGAWWSRRLALQADPAYRRIHASRLAEMICGYVAVSFWAMLGTAPLTAFHFNQFAVVGIVANAIVVPIMGLGAVVCGLVAAALSFIWAAPAREILHAAGWLAALGTGLAGWFVGWPGAWVRTFTPTILELAVAYTVLGIWLLTPLPEATFHAGTKLPGPPTAQTIPWPSRSIVLAMLAIVCVADGAWWSYQRYFNPDLRVTFLSVGQGDAAVVRFPGSRVMLIDGGGGFSSVFDPGERIVAPYLWSRKIMHVDYLVVSHPDRDHFGGFTYIARNFSPTELWTGSTTSDDASYLEMLNAADAAGARRRECVMSSPPVTIGGVEVRCFWPPLHQSEIKQNNASMVVRLRLGALSILFTGDLEAKGEAELLGTGADLGATILKVPHHGSASSSTQGLIEGAHPQVAVISDGYLNRFHFPAPEVVERYKDDGATVLRTDLDGAISLEANGRSLELRSFRNGKVVLSRLSGTAPKAAANN